MADITYEWYISKILNSNKKSHWRTRYWIHKVEDHISGLRFTALKMKGTTVGSFCNKEANRFDRLLKGALGQGGN